jgi:hypothetical protein
MYYTIFLICIHYLSSHFFLRNIWVICFPYEIFALLFSYRSIFRFMVFNATFNNIAVISWRSVLLVEETDVPGENHRPVASYWQTLVFVDHCLSFFLKSLRFLSFDLWHLISFRQLQSFRPPRYNWNIVESGVKHHKPKDWATRTPLIMNADAPQLYQRNLHFSCAFVSHQYMYRCCFVSVLFLYSNGSFYLCSLCLFCLFSRNLFINTTYLKP